MYTPEGFAIAADGRVRSLKDEIVISDSAQKIFAINEPNKSLAYALAGSVGLSSNPNAADTVFEFVDETAKVLQTADFSKAATLGEYITTLCSSLEARLLKAKAHYPTGDPLPGHPGFSAIAYIFLDRGLLPENPEPWDGYVRAQEPNITDHRCQPKGGWIAAYRVKPRQPGKPTLKEASEMVRASVAAASDPRALQLDEAPLLCHWRPRTCCYDHKGTNSSANSCGCGTRFSAIGQPLQLGVSALDKGIIVDLILYPQAP